MSKNECSRILQIMAGKALRTAQAPDCARQHTLAVAVDRPHVGVRIGVDNVESLLRTITQITLECMEDINALLQVLNQRFLDLGVTRIFIFPDGNGFSEDDSVGTAVRQPGIVLAVKPDQRRLDLAVHQLGDPAAQ